MEEPLAAGTWQGFWTHFDAPERHAMRFEATSAPSRFEAVGEDEVGPYTLSGRPRTEAGCWTLTKQYTGKHAVVYEAERAAAGFVGRWHLGELCGGAFVLWPGGPGDPPRELLGMVPRVELIPRATRWKLAGLGWASLGMGLLGLVLGIKAAASRQGAFLGFLLFGVYLWITGSFQSWIHRRIIRRALGPLGSDPALFKTPSGSAWKRPVTPVYVLEVFMIAAAVFWALQIYHQKRWPGSQ